MQEKINVPVQVNQQVNVEVDPDEILDAINGLNLPTRWNYIAYFLKNIQVSVNDLTPAQFAVVFEFLEGKLAQFREAQKTAK